METSPGADNRPRQASLAPNRCDGMIILVSPAAMTLDLVEAGKSNTH